MNRSLKRISILTAAIISFVNISYSQNDLPAYKIFELVNNSVVVILAYDNDTDIYQGSGIVINNNGYIATNYHVCSDAEKIVIKHYDKEIDDVSIIFTDTLKDLMILKVSGDNFKPIKFGDSKNLKPGQRVYAIGSPEGYENSISDGIISGFRYDENNMALIQMTTPITEGSSGGALVNTKGELIGLSVSGMHEGNIYFAIPSDELRADLDSNKIVADFNESVNYLVEGDKATKKDDYEDAILYFSKYLEKNHDDADAYYKRGYANLKLKKFKVAINDFTNALKSKTDNYEIFFYRGNCYYILRMYLNAIEDYTKAIELAPQYSELYYNRGYSYYKLTQYNNCLKDWQIAIDYENSYEGELTPLIKKIKDYLNNEKK